MKALPPDAKLDHDDDGDLFVETPRVRLDADPGCFRRLRYHCRLLADALDPLDSVPGLMAQGYINASRLAAVMELDHPAGHRIVMVPRTRRVAIRLDVDTPLEHRAAEATALAEAIARAASKGSRPESPAD